MDKKKIFAGIAILALIVGVCDYLFFHVDGQGTLTGLEEKVSEKVSKKEEFHIVEIIPDGAVGEIGCLVKNEKDLVQEQMNDYLTKYIQEDSSNQNTREVRLAYVERLQTVYGDAMGEKDKPMTLVQPYVETYFADDPENWKYIDFAKENYEQAVLKGWYEPDPEHKGAYEMNIRQFDYSADTGSYKVTFGSTMLADKEEAIYRQPYHVKTDADGNQLIVDDTQIMEVAGADETVGLYYIQSFEYVGSDNPEALYAPIQVTEEPYYYVGENGTYHFRMDDSMPETVVTIGRIYYKFDLENHDWLREKVFASKDSKDLEIEVVTLQESELSGEEAVKQIAQADFIYVCGDMERSGKLYQSPETVWTAIGAVVTEQKVPCMIDASTKVWEHTGTYKEGYGEQNDFVRENVYIFGSKDENSRQPVYTDFDTVISDTSGLGEVSAFVNEENLMRSGKERLSTDFNRAFLMQYIIDYSRQRSIGVKESFRVLEIQPTDAVAADTQGFKLTKEDVAKWAGVSEDTQIEITSMSTAEFIGKVEDLNKEYDLIYLGACIDYFNTKSVSGVKTTAFNDTRMNGLIYMHTGDYVAGKLPITGMMDTDYSGAYRFQNSTGVPKPYAKNKKYLLYNNGGTELLMKYTYIKNRTSYTNGVLTQNLENGSPWVYYEPVGENDKLGRDRVGDVMIYRYSGNDITKTRLEDLLEYVGANYPLVISDALINTNADGKNVVNTEAVDNTSYLYQFMEQIKDYENVFTVTQAGNADNRISSYLNLPKPKLLYFDLNTPEQLEEYTGVTTNAGDIFNDVSKMVIDKTNGEQNGTYVAKVGFYLDSTVDASLSSVYTPKFYLDLNADGKFLESGANDSSEQMNCVIYNVDTGEEAPKDEAGNYQLTSRVRYRLEREIPATYLGVLTWKLEVVQSANNSIRTSNVQYTKIDGTGTEETVKVLQITSQKNGNETTTINLNTETYIKKYLKDIKETTGLNFEISTIGGYDFGEQAATSGQDYYDKYLQEYDMLIIGFADMYYDLDNRNGAVDAIYKFIESGKSVLFSHDVTSFINVPEENTYEDIHLVFFSDDLSSPHEWGYDMNNYFRSVLAMDRYGITSDENTSLSEDDELKKQSNLLRQAQHLTVNTQTGDATVNKCKDGNSSVYFTTRGITSGKLNPNRDIAYAAKTYNSANGTAQSYGQTHGYTNGLLNRFLVDETKYLGDFENNTQKKNLRNDLLPSGNSNSTGIGRAKVTSVNDGLITHYPYEIGQEFTSAPTHFQYYQLNLDQDEDGDGRGDVVVWYCLSGVEGDANANKVYANNKNDARNNYYIYNVGNVTYTGMGHAALVHEGSDLEAKLFVNTIVAAYKAGVGSPVIKIQETSERGSAEKKYEYITYDDAAGNTALTEDVEFYFTISDPNLTPSKKTMTVSFSYNNGTEEVSLGADQIEVVDVTANAPVTGNYTEGHVYKATLKDASGKMATVDTGSLEIKAKVNSSFDYYGRKESHDAQTTLTILKMSLFDLN